MGMYFILSGPHVVATFDTWSELLVSVSQLIPPDSSVVSLLSKSTRENCAGKPMPLYAVFGKGNPRDPPTYLMVQKKC